MIGFELGITGKASREMVSCMTEYANQVQRVMTRDSFLVFHCFVRDRLLLLGSNSPCPPART
jgi:hypothetical protein